MKPRIFVSAVSRELKTARQLVANTLLALGFEPIWQDIFETSSEDIRPMLRRQIDSCSAVIQIVGDAYGTEPPKEDEEFGRISYTQFEAKYAESTGKKVYYLIAQPDMPRDVQANLVDSSGAETDGSKSDAAERMRLQQSYLSQIKSKEHIFYPVESHSETELSVRRLKEELDRLRRGFRRWILGVSAALILIAVVLGVVYVQQIAERTRQEQERIAQQEEREKQQIEREAARITRQQQRDFFSKFEKQMLYHLAKNQRATSEQARHEAILESQKSINLSSRQLQAILDRTIPRQTLVEEAQSLLAAGNYDKVFEIADREREKQHELAMVVAVAAIARYQDSPSPTYGTKAVEALSKLLAYSKSDSAEWVDVAKGLAILAQSLNNYSDAEQLLRQANDICLKIHGKMTPETADLHSTLGRLLIRTNRLSEAETLMRKALLIDEEFSGPESILVANRLSGLAEVLVHVNHLTEAEQLMRRALAIDEKLLDPSHPSIARDLSDLGVLLLMTGRTDEAEPLMRRALAIVKKSFNRNHPRLANALSNLGQLLLDANRITEATPLLHRALDIDETSFGPEHPVVARDLSNLGQLLHLTNRVEEAEPLLRRALAIAEKSFGPNHPTVARHLHTLALLLADDKSNRLPEAECLLRRALLIDEKSYGPEHPIVAGDLGDLGHLVYLASRMEKAEPLIRRALTIAEKSLGPKHPLVAKQLHNLAMLLMDTNRLSDAEHLVRRALSIYENSLGPQHPRVTEGFRTLASVLISQDLLAEAEPFLTRAIQIDEKSFGPGHPRVGIATSDLAFLLMETGRFDEAEPLMHRALLIDRASFGGEHPRTALQLNNIGQLLCRTKRSSDAEPLMRSALEIDLNFFGPEVLVVARDLINLAVLLKDTKRLSEAEKLMRAALGLAARCLSFDHPAIAQYKIEYELILKDVNIDKKEIAVRVKSATNIDKSSLPTLPEIEELLGPTKNTEKVLELLIHKYENENEYAKFFSDLEMPVRNSIHILLDSADLFVESAIYEYEEGRFQEAVLKYDTAIEMLADNTKRQNIVFDLHLCRAISKIDAGCFESAKFDLIKLLTESDLPSDSDSKGRAQYNLARCHWSLGDNESAIAALWKSIAEYGDEKLAAESKKESESLLANIQNNKKPPELPSSDPELELERARARYRSILKLAEHSDSKPASPFIDEILGPAKPVEEVFKKLDQQYREQGKPDIWFLPITEPIFPHLDELLGPIEEPVKEKSDEKIQSSKTDGN